MPVVSVVGEASVAIQADTAVIGAGVTSQGKTAREAIDVNTRAMTAVLAALKDAGIADGDIQTARFAVQPVNDQGHGGPPKIIGFQVTNQVNIKLHDAGTVGDIIDRLAGAGANTLSGVEFQVSDPSKALDEARRAGMADAQRKAQLYAKMAGAGLGHAVAIDEQTVAPRFLRVAAPAAGAPPIAAGEDTLRIAVTVTYELLY
jgi:hypothetical protein